MSLASALTVADPPLAGGALPGAGLLRLLGRFMRTGMAMARCVNRIARQKLEGHDLSRLAPAGFDATLTNAFVVQAVAFTAALRERLRALAGRPVEPLAPGLPKPERGPRGRGTTYREITYEASPDERHDWPDLARSWRMGPGGVRVALRMIAGKSDREVVADISSYLQRAAVQLGAEADVARIAALEAAARALCPDADRAPAVDMAADADGDETADAGGAAAGAPGAHGGRARPAGPPSGRSEDGAGHDPPPEPPD